MLILFRILTCSILNLYCYIYELMKLFEALSKKFGSVAAAGKAAGIVDRQRLHSLPESKFLVKYMKFFFWCKENLKLSDREFLEMLREFSHERATSKKQSKLESLKSKQK